mmetsp:Transcript_9287/g.27894  ORF Transcript_9287/g.27894 Transcript_9287/m.27894 type:complete len:435 (+) Transcript_9287:281-1585(+)
MGLLRRLQAPKDTAAAVGVAVALLAAEAALSLAITQWVPYTEIDWTAYMEQTRLFAEGERDYLNIKGGTGPLVYPAGFVYLFDGLRRVTRDGEIPTAQLWFAALYLLTQAGVMALYIYAQIVPPWALVLLCASKRIHSIWLLRLFNDGPAMGLAYVGIAALLARRHRLAVVLLSAGVSVKMNVLLFAPPVLVVLLQETSPAVIMQGVTAGVGLQLMLGAPFLVVAPTHYVSRAFEMSRVFLHVWSVNLKFLPPWLFQSRGVAVTLLTAHLALLMAFAACRWTEQPGGLSGLLCRSGSTPFGRKASTAEQPDKASSDTRLGAPGQLSAAHVLATLFTGNFIGIVCARTLHYQFYSWYFHTLPALLWWARLSTPRRLGLWLCIEVVWNIYPSTPASSVLLAACHTGLLWGLWQSPRWLGAIQVDAATAGIRTKKAS